MTNQNTIAEVVTNAVVVALQQVLPTILATTENKASETTKVATKVATTKSETKETIKKAEKPATTKTPTMPEECPTEKQQAYYVSLCDKFGLKPKADLTKKSISLEIGLLKKHGKKANGYVAKGNKPTESKKTPETKVSVPTTPKSKTQALLEKVTEAQKNADYATMLHNLVAVARIHAETKDFAKAKAVIKSILDKKLCSVTAMSEKDCTIFRNTLSAIQLHELTK